jgi:hypothetical protein
MTKHLLRAVALASAPFTAIAQGIPQTVTAETLRVTGGAMTDAVKSNQELSDTEKAQPNPPAMVDKPPPRHPAPAPTPAPNPAPAR